MCAGSAADRYQVVVRIDEKSLRGGIGRADLPVDTVKRLTCDGSLVTVTKTETGAPLDVGRKQRTVPTPMKRALWARDRGCSFPGCDHKHYVDAHHIEHWADAAPRASTTSRCSARTITGCCTRAVSRSITTPTTTSISGGRTGG